MAKGSWGYRFSNCQYLYRGNNLMYSPWWQAERLHRIWNVGVMGGLVLNHFNVNLTKYVFENPKSTIQINLLIYLFIFFWRTPKIYFFPKFIEPNMVREYLFFFKPFIYRHNVIIKKKCMTFKWTQQGFSLEQTRNRH